MKNTIFILTVLLFVGLLFSCSDDQSNKVLNTDGNVTIFKDLDLLENPSPNFFDNQFYLIEQLGENKEKQNVLSTIKDNNVDLNLLSINDIKKFYLANSIVEFYSIPYKNLNSKLILYNFEGVYEVNVIEYYQIENSITEYKLKTLDDVLNYSLQINEDNKIGNIITHSNEIMEEYSARIYFEHNTMHSIDYKPDGKVGYSTCCRNRDGWSDCFSCTVSACGDSWVCTAAMVVAGPEMIVAMGASCIGAGEGAKC